MAVMKRVQVCREINYLTAYLGQTKNTLTICFETTSIAVLHICMCPKT